MHCVRNMVTPASDASQVRNCHGYYENIALNILTVNRMSLNRANFDSS